ncbi:MAG: non-canonical purine NTP pyrophosphatase [Thermoplasmatales archaeon SG8-52-3]|nr:MAG: non-canonical purine NTP pyrophosphatase [Thermoplasmatales archaeon SG8-52-3]
MKTLYFITGNKGKLLEAKKRFSKINFEIIQKDIGYPEIQADSLEEVALFGVNDIQKRFDKPFFLEDAGLFIDSLNGFPGVYSAYVFYKIGCSGILKLMEKYEGNKRKACFRSVIVYKGLNKDPEIFIGESYGLISKISIGDYGFGYDPIFIPENEKRTFAQMETDEKNRFSHRGKSLNKLINYIKN